jgi:hypothetical protein
VLLLISLPVLAGRFIVPALNLAECWKLLNGQSAGNLINGLLKILRDYTPCSYKSRMKIESNVKE